jgi:hypothetical protein
MRRYLARFLAVAALVGGSTVVATGVAASDPGPGTYTKITTPGATTFFRYNASPGAPINHFTVSGTTSPDVTSVDIVCPLMSATGDVTPQTFAQNVPVSAGAFSAIAVFPNLIAQCRLRAIPVGVDPSDTYLGSYAGPVIYTEATGNVIDGGVIDDVLAVSEAPGGIVGAGDDSDCIGVFADSLIDAVTGRVEGSGIQGCYLGLGASNATTSGTSTGSAVQVSGQNAYLPSGVATYLNDVLALGLTQPAVTSSTHVASNHDITVTESEPLVRCPQPKIYPPSTTSCAKLVSTGVTDKHVETLSGADASAQVRDSFVSTDGKAHSLDIEYGGARMPLGTGSTGYEFSGHGSTFVTEAKGPSVTGLGTKAGSMLIRSDIDAAPDDPAAETDVISWSRAPRAVQFSKTVGSLGIRFALTVPAKGSVSLDLDLSANLTTASAESTAALALAGTVARPTVAKPVTKVHGKVTAVAGSVADGANGAVRSVTVNGHKAKLTVGATATKFAVKLTESLGAHTLKVVATDVAGNTASTTVKVKNVQ